MTNDNDSIYLELGSVWRRGDEWRMFRRVGKVLAEYATFGGSLDFQYNISVWLAWAKHPDTVLVYSPSGNKLPVKDGWVRTRIPVIIDGTGAAWHHAQYSPHDDIVELFGYDGTRIFIEFDAKLPTKAEPGTVEGGVSDAV